MRYRPAGFEVGSPFICVIDQICGQEGNLRVATHSNIVSVEYQTALLKEIQDVWEIIQSGWIFRDVTREQSDAICAAYDKGLPESTGRDPWFDKVTAQQPW